MVATRCLGVVEGEGPLHDGIRAIKREQDLPDCFPPEVEAAAQRVATSPRLPELDRTDLPLVTVDPEGAMDLDQALHVERRGKGFRVHYAIADVAAFVSPGDAIDQEAHRRGETLYGADAKVPLHPPALSEAAASLLPGELRPALLWTMDLDATGEGIVVDLQRARVRSRARFDYAGLQAQIDAGKADPMWDVLREIGALRKQREQIRGGISLPLPEQEMDQRSGRWELGYRARHPVEDWNEQISLLTGMAAAHLMLQGRVGLLRTLPPPQDWMIERLRRSARTLRLDWPAQVSYQDFIRSLDPTESRAIAMMVACTSLLRGAAYVAFDGELPENAAHWALASEYTHVTAPLRRLVDRYIGELCLALCAGTPVPDWVMTALSGLPATMQASGQRASRFERAVIDLAEAIALAPRVGEMFEGGIVEVDRKDKRRGMAMLRELGIEAPVSGDAPLPLGQDASLRLEEADVEKRAVRFQSCSNHTRMSRAVALLCAFVFCCTPAMAGESKEVLVIAHRGASAIYPEHTLAAYVRAIEDGADYIEPDIALTRDGVAVARHDVELSATTDVADRAEFAGRKRRAVVSGKRLEGWFVDDFTIDELKRLRARQRYPEFRSIKFDDEHPIPTLREIVQLVAAESARRGRRIGVAPEIKHAAYFHDQGLAIEQRVLEELLRSDEGPSIPLIIQSFDEDSLKKVRAIVGKSRSDVSLLMLLSRRTAVTGKSLARIAEFAEIIGPDLRMVIPWKLSGGLGTPTGLVKDAHAAGLRVIPYTFAPEDRFLPRAYRKGSGKNPESGRDFSAFIGRYLDTGIDGLFIDDPAPGVVAVRERKTAR